MDTKAKCNHKKISLQRQVFIRVYRLEIQSVMLVFSTQFCKLLPSDVLSDLTPPPPPFSVSKYNMYRQCVAGRGGCVESCWRP
jgi:hypothetical protein